jgi:hypothetical protein
VVIRTGTGAIALTRGQRDDDGAGELLDASALGRLLAERLADLERRGERRTGQK